jgi:hypothetical protein
MAIARAHKACAAARDVTQIGCLAIADHAIEKHADALALVAKLRAAAGDTALYVDAGIYAQCGRPADALAGGCLQLTRRGLEFPQGRSDSAFFVKTAPHHGRTRKKCSYPQEGTFCIRYRIFGGRMPPKEFSFRCGQFRCRSETRWL